MADGQIDDEPIDYLPRVLELQDALARKWEDEAAKHPASERMVLAFVEACDAYGLKHGVEREEVSLQVCGHLLDLAELEAGKPITAVFLNALFDRLDAAETDQFGLVAIQ